MFLLYEGSFSTIGLVELTSIYTVLQGCKCINYHKSSYTLVEGYPICQSSFSTTPQVNTFALGLIKR